MLLAAVLLLVALSLWWTQRQPVTEIGKNISTPVDSLPKPTLKQEPIAQTTPQPETVPQNPLPAPKDYAALTKNAYADSPFDAGTLMGEGDEPDESSDGSAGPVSVFSAWNA